MDDRRTTKGKGETSAEGEGQVRTGNQTPGSTETLADG